jgi:YhcH/YjgK/YiaL family protein
MIIDKLQNAFLYENLSSRITAGLRYLAETDFRVTADGRYPLDGTNLYAVVSRYKTKEVQDCKLESHKKYIDIQFIASGCEQIGVALLDKQIPSVAYNEEKDVMFYKENVSMIRLEKGDFAIFFPGDLHMPGAKCTDPSDVIKVVVKVKI